MLVVLSCRDADATHNVRRLFHIYDSRDVLLKMIKSRAIILLFAIISRMFFYILYTGRLSRIYRQLIMARLHLISRECLHWSQSASCGSFVIFLKIIDRAEGDLSAPWGGAKN